MKGISPKKALQRRRKMSHFIDAADEIISEKGIESLTIRGVSDIAGYNSATLYGYFSSLDHLIYYTYMKHITEFDQLLRPAFEMSGKPSKSFEVTWRLFCKFAFENPNVIYTFMFSPYSKNFSEILEDYKQIYSDDFKTSLGEGNELLFKDSIFDVVLVKLQLFEKGLNISAEEIDEMNSFIQTYFQGQLVRRMTFESDLDIETYMERMVRFVDQIVWSYTAKKKA